MLAGAAAARTRIVQQPAANHPHRRADDTAHDGVLKPTPIKGSAKLVTKDERLMNDWPAGDETARAKRGAALPVWYSKPWLLAALWGRLPAAPRD